MNKFMRQSLWTGIKLAGAGSTLVLIAIAIVTFYPTTGVKNSEADISWGATFKRSNTQKFVTTLDALGHSEPRSYNYNGNTVFFSSKTTSQSPREVMLEYQNAFVKSGINERPYLELLSVGTKADKQPQNEKQALERLEKVATGPSLAMLSGQIVPTSYSPGAISMGGGLITGEPTTNDAAAKIVKQSFKDKTDFATLFKGYRAIDITRDDGDDVTHVTASWSDGNMDLKKHLRTPYGQAPIAANPDPEVPSCPGCNRITRFAGEKAESKYVSNVFDSPQHHITVSNFYLESMKNRGWRETESSEMTRRALEYTTLNHLHSHAAIQLVRGEDFLTVAVAPNGLHRSLVTTISSD